MKESSAEIHSDISTPNPFDLARMKQLFGPPVLLGNEQMKGFDEYATAILQDLEPGDALMAGLAYQFVLESYSRMRLMRYQSRIVQAQMLSQRSKLSPTTSPIDREEEATKSLHAKLSTYGQLDTLISEATKRETLLLGQLGIYRLALAEKLARKQDLEEKKIEIKERKRQERNQRALEHFLKSREEKAAMK